MHSSHIRNATHTKSFFTTTLIHAIQNKQTNKQCEWEQKKITRRRKREMKLQQQQQQKMRKKTRWNLVFQTNELNYQEHGKWLALNFSIAIFKSYSHQIVVSRISNVFRWNAHCVFCIKAIQKSFGLCTRYKYIHAIILL